MQNPPAPPQAAVASPRAGPLSEKGDKTAFALNVVPLLIALWLLVRMPAPGQLFQTIGIMVGIGFLSTIGVAGVYLFAVRKKEIQAQSPLTQPKIQQMAWIVLAVFFFVGAVDKFHVAIFAKSMFLPRTWLGVSLDVSAIASITVAIGIFLLMVFAPRLKLPPRAYDRHSIRRSLAQVMNLWLIVPPAIAALFWRLAATPQPAGKEHPLVVDQSGWHLLLSAAGLLVFIFAFLSRAKSLFEIFSPGNGRKSALSAQSASMQLSVVILPPIIGAIQIASREGVDDPTSIVFGLFIYGGFMTWTLGIEIARSGWRSACGSIALVFALSFMISVLWVFFLKNLGPYVPNAQQFDSALNIALGSIFIQIVFGMIYRRAWEHGLSSRWQNENSNYIIVAILSAIIVGALDAGWPQTLLLCFLVVALIGMPVWILRRSVSAHLLIRIKPGMTQSVQRKLTAAGVMANSVYGTHDLIAHVELLRSVLAKDENVLSKLGSDIRSKIAGIDGIVATETLLDFSHQTFDLAPVEKIE